MIGIYMSYHKKIMKIIKKMEFLYAFFFILIEKNIT